MAQWFMHVTSYSKGDNFKSLSRAQHNFWVTLDCLSAVTPGSLPMKTSCTRPAREPSLGVGACYILLKQDFEETLWRNQIKEPDISVMLRWCQTQAQFYVTKRCIPSDGCSLVPELRHCTDISQFAWTRSLQIICIINTFGPQKTQHLCQLFQLGWQRRSPSGELTFPWVRRLDGAAWTHIAGQCGESHLCWCLQRKANGFQLLLLKIFK